MKFPVIRGMALLIVMLAAFEIAAETLDEEDLALSYGGEEFLSIATGRQQPVSKAPAVATVITAEEIREMGATNLDQVLESVPGLHVSLSSLRFSPLYSIRGIHTDSNPQVLMLVNGVPLTQVFLGDRGPNSTLPVASIQRVEVIRGPGSAVYGADAFAGVINVITKSAADIDGTEAGVRVGSFNTQELWLLHGGKWGEFDVAFSLEASTTDGDDGRIIESDAQSFFDSQFGTSASLAPGPVDTWEERVDTRLELSREQWTLRLWNWRQSGGVGAGLAQALDPTGEGETDNYLTDITYHDSDIGQHWDLMARASYMDINTRSRQTLYPAGTILPIGDTGTLNGNIDRYSTKYVVFTDGFIGNPEVYEQHTRFDLSALYSGFESHHLRVAGGIHYVELDPKESKNFGPGVIDGTTLNSVPPGPINFRDGTLTDVTGTSDIYIRSEKRTVYYASLQDEWSLAPDWELTAGVRYDHYSDFGSTTNPRLALVWNTRHDLTTKFLYGRAFRAPSFAELYNINNPVILGNENLEPEVINTGEIAFDYRPTFDLQTGLNLFAYRIDDLIRFMPDPGGTSTAQNTDGQEGYGFELEFEWLLSKQFSLSGNYAFQHSMDKETDSAVPNAPKQQLYLLGKWHFQPNWLFNTQISWIGDRQRADDDPRPDISDYTIVDLGVRNTRVTDKLELALGVRNLFDEQANEPSPAEPALPVGSFIPGDYPLEGRSFYAEAQYRF